MREECQTLMKEIEVRMTDCLNDEQLRTLDNVLIKCLYDYDVVKKQTEIVVYDNKNDLALKYFINSLKINGRSMKTIDQYKKTTQAMLDCIGKSYDTITVSDCQFYFAQMQGRISERTYNNYIMFVKQFFKWLHEEEYITFNPMSKIKKVKEKESIKLAFTDEERVCLIENAKTLRDKAILSFLYSTGCRVSELVAVDIKDVQHDGSLIIYATKNSKERYVCVDQTAMYYLKRYINSRTDDNPALFVSDRKVGGEYIRISTNSVERMCRTLGMRCGVEKVHPHRYRRTCATHGLDKGMGIEKMQRYLGHAGIETTELYYDSSKTDIISEHRRYIA